MGKTKTYNEYKPTDIGWLPAIPSQWDIVDTKRCFSFPKEIVGSDFNSYKVLSLSVNGVIFRDMASGAGKHHSDMGTYQIVRPETIVLCLFDMDVTPRIVGHSDKTGIITSAYVNIAPKENIVSKYYYYYFLLQDFNKYLFSQGTGIRTTLTRSQFGALKIALPSKEEQAKIAAFLDFKLAKIDRFIRKKKQLIKLLNEQKAAIINQAVTKGLNPNAKMKPSGIDWLGEIPEHWEGRKLKTIVSIKITDGPHETPEFVEQGIPFISAEAVNSDGSISFENRRADISKELDKIYSLKCKPKRDDVFIVKSGSTTGKIGYVNTDLDFNIWSPLALVRSKKDLITGEYTFRTLQSPYFQMQVQTKWSFGTQPNIGMGILENLYLIVPPKNEQFEILKFINEEIQIVERTISTIEKEIALVEEYKTALIAEAVTGKIDVRDFEIPETLEEETYVELEEEISITAESETEYETEEIE